MGGEKPPLHAPLQSQQSQKGSLGWTQGQMAPGAQNTTKATFCVAQPANQAEKPMSGYLGAPQPTAPGYRNVQRPPPQPSLANANITPFWLCGLRHVLSPLCASVSPPHRAAIRTKYVHVDKALRTGPGILQVLNDC